VFDVIVTADVVSAHCVIFQLDYRICDSTINLLKLLSSNHGYEK